MPEVEGTKRKIETSLKKKDKAEFVAAMIELDNLLDVLGIVEKEIEYIEDAKRRAVERRMFESIDDINEALIEEHLGIKSKRVKEILSELRSIEKEKLIEKAIGESSIKKLAELIDKLTRFEDELPTLNADKKGVMRAGATITDILSKLYEKAADIGISEEDIEAAGAAPEKGKRKKKKSNIVEELEEATRRLEESGVTTEEAEEAAIRRKLKKWGLVYCAVCARLIGPLEPAIQDRTGEWLHVTCWHAEQEHIQAELEERFLVIADRSVYCPYCNEPIKMSEGWIYNCPPGIIVTGNNPECVYFHAECYREWAEEAQRAGEVLRDRTWRVFQIWLKNNKKFVKK